MNKIVGFKINTEILFGEETDNMRFQSLLCDIENEISTILESKFDCKVLGGTGGFIYADKDNKLIK